MSRLRTGEWLGLAGGVALLVLLFLPWFDGRIGWTSLGWLMIGLLVLCMARGRLGRGHDRRRRAHADPARARGHDDGGGARRW